MTTVILNPAKAAETVCHPEQMTIWSHEIVVALGMAGLLKEELSYDDGLEAHFIVERELRDIIESAFDHPEARTIRRVP